MTSHCNDSTLKGVIKLRCSELSYRPGYPSGAGWVLSKLPVSMLLSAATGVRLEELPVNIRKHELASQGREQ